MEKSEKSMPIEMMSLKQLQELLNTLREEFPELEDKIKDILGRPVCSLGDILMRTTEGASYAIYQACTQYHSGFHYPILHNLWTGRTRTIMGNTEKNIITAKGYDSRPSEWDYEMLEDACRHHAGLLPGYLKKIGTLRNMQDFLMTLKSDSTRPSET